MRTKLEPGARWWWEPEDVGEPDMKGCEVTLVRGIEDGATTLEDDDAAKWTVDSEAYGEFDAYERELLPLKHTESPEKTGRYECPHCGEEERFRGIDSRCGADQTFKVDEEGEADYDCYDGWEIGSYTEIQCVSCEHTIWEEDPPHLVIVLKGGLVDSVLCNETAMLLGVEYVVRDIDEDAEDETAYTGPLRPEHGSVAVSATWAEATS